MKVQNMIRYIRLNIDVADPDDECCTDRAYLELSDDDIRLYLDVCLTRDFASVPSLELLPRSCVYPLLLLVKKELYYSFAVYHAPEVDMNADMNNSLRRSQRFEHYMELIKQVDAEYQDWLENGGSSSEDGVGNNTLTTFDVTLPNTRYFTKSYHQKGVAPSPQVAVHDFTDTTVDLVWVSKARQFAWCNVYVSKNPLYDPFKDGRNKIVDAEKHLYYHTMDSRQNTIRLTGLDPSTTYYVVVEVVDKSGLTGYSNVEVSTSEEAG